MADVFRIGGGLQDLPNSVRPNKHKLERNNVERAVNDEMMEKRLAGQFEKFPMHTHKAGGLVRRVENEDELQDALSKGWKADIREIEVAEPTTQPEHVNHMTVKQAEAFIKAHGSDGAKLAEMLQDETSHGNRAAVVALITKAADALGAPKSSKTAEKPAKAAKTPKKK